MGLRGTCYGAMDRPDTIGSKHCCKYNIDDNNTLIYLQFTTNKSYLISYLSETNILLEEFPYPHNFVLSIRYRNIGVLHENLSYLS